MNKDGGLAFPEPCCPGVCEPGVGHDGDPSRGMSLLDWFAGQIASSVYQSVVRDAATLDLSDKGVERDIENAFLGLADSCYLIASYLLRAREKFTKGG